MDIEEGRKKGHNSRGIITARHRGGGHKRLYRQIDFRRTEKDIYGRIVTIEYDPNRNTHICLIHYRDGKKRSILHPRGAIIGDTIVAGKEVPIKMENALPLTEMPLGTAIHNIEITLGKGGQLARAAGAVAKLIAKEGKSATVKLPSGEVRLISKNCSATIGQVGNVGVNQKSLGKAGSKRWRGKRPVVRGVVMNPVDHPHGGGEGRPPIGRKKPTRPWGYPALERRTRKRKKSNLVPSIYNYAYNDWPYYCYPQWKGTFAACLYNSSYGRPQIGGIRTYSKFRGTCKKKR